MAEKEQHNAMAKTDENNDDIPKPRSTTGNKEKNQDKSKEENERTIEQIDAELDELRPKPSSPETQRKIAEKQREKDEEEEERGKPDKNPMPIKIKDSNEDESPHKGNELIPGQPDPTVTDDMKIPVMNERGDIELKLQQGSSLNKNQNKPPDSTNQPEQNKTQSEKNKEAEN